jgi:hypothetical protein
LEDATNDRVEVRDRLFGWIELGPEITPLPAGAPTVLALLKNEAFPRVPAS